MASSSGEGAKRRQAPVAQLDRASVYGTEGQRFESSRAHYKIPANQQVFVGVQSCGLSITRFGRLGGEPGWCGAV